MPRRKRNRPDWDWYFFYFAQAAARRATCPRKQVGAILVKENRLVSTGYNGAPSGEPHCTDVGCDMIDGHCKRAIHAEINALNYSRYPVKGSTLYSTLQPCKECRSALEEAGITNFKWLEDYPKKG